MAPQGPRLFVSHPSSKLDTAGHIERALNARGVNCWIAPRDIEPSEPFDRSVRNAIATTDAVLLLFCADSEKSRHVKRELILADSLGKAIIPMRLERIEPHELSYHLADTQWIDWIEQRDDAIDRIAAKAREFHAQHEASQAADTPKVSIDKETAPSSPARAYGAFDASAAPPPPFPPYQPSGGPAPDRTRTFLWIGIGGVLLIAATIAIILLVSRGSGPRQLTAEWFAGTWSDTRACTEMYRFDRSGSVTAPDGSQGRWYVEENNMLVVEGIAGTERRRVEIISDDHVTGPDGNAYRCFAGAT